MSYIMSYEEMQECQEFLMQTYADQGGACTFLSWVYAVADDAEEFGHEEAKAYIKWCN